MNILDQLVTYIFKLLETSFVFLFEFFEMLFTGVPKKNKEFNAEFVSAGSLLSRWNHGFNLSGTQSLPIKKSFEGTLCIGATGTGKSATVILPTLYTIDGSLIIHDPSSELYNKSSAYRKQIGYEIKILNFANPAISSGYNPLARAHSSSEIQKIAAVLVRNAFGGEAKDFWNIQTISLLSMLISIVKTQDIQYQNLYNVRQLLNQLSGDPESVDTLFSRYANPILFCEYKAFIGYDEKVRSGVIATAKAALQIFNDESVALVTSSDTLDFKMFREKKVALYIQNSIADQKYYSVITSLFFEQFFAYGLSGFPERGEQNIYLLVDEFSSLYIPTLPLATANCRKYSIGIMLLVQDFAQIVHHYGRYDAEAIRSNCFAKLFFTAQSLESSKELESILGKTEVETADKKKVVRPLMTSSEIRIMPSNRALLIAGNHKPIYLRLKPYYKRLRFLKYSKLPPCEMQSELSGTTISILNLNNSEDSTHA